MRSSKELELINTIVKFFFKTKGSSEVTVFGIYENHVNRDGFLQSFHILDVE